MQIVEFKLLLTIADKADLTPLDDPMELSKLERDVEDAFATFFFDDRPVGAYLKLETKGSVPYPDSERRHDQEWFENADMYAKEHLK